MKNLIMAAIAALISAACSQPPAAGAFEPSYVDPTALPDRGAILPMSLQMSPDLTTEEQEGIANAVARWGDRTGGAADVDLFVGTDPGHPCRVRLVESLPYGGDTTIGGAYGCDVQLIRSEMESAKVRYPRSAPIYTTVVEQVMMHELGHVFGLGHLPDEKSIMFWMYSPKNILLDDAAVDAFCDLRGCPGRTLGQ